MTITMTTSPAATRVAAVILLGATLALLVAPPSASRAAEDAKPPIVSRADWGAKPPSMSMRPHEIERITVHHTGVLRSTKRPTVQLVRNLQSFSQSDGKLADGRSKKAWADVPYHFYIGRDGTIVEGRDPAFAGDTNTEYDPAGHLGIAVSGNFNEQEVSDAQLASLVSLLAWASEEYDVPVERIAGHGDYASTACPGEDLGGMLGSIRQEVSLINGDEGGDAPAE